MKIKNIVSIVLAVLLVSLMFALPLSATALSDSWYNFIYSWEDGGLGWASPSLGLNQAWSNYIRTDDFIDITGYNELKIQPHGVTSYIFTYSDDDIETEANRNGYGPYTSDTTLNIATDFPSGTKYIRMSAYTTSGATAGDNIVLSGSFSLNPALIDSTKRGSLKINKYELENISESVRVGTGYELNSSDLPTNARPINGVTFSIKRVADVSSTYFTQTGTSLPTVSQAQSMQSLNTYTATTATVNSVVGVAQFTNLPLGIYLVEEVSAPAHVETASSFVMSIPSTSLDGQSWKYDFNIYPKNKAKYCDVRVKKVDRLSQSTLLSGAAFSVYKSETNSNYTSLNSTTYTTTNGYVTIPHLPVNNYYRLRETFAPTNYVLDNNAVSNTDTYFYLDDSGAILSTDKKTTIGTPDNNATPSVPATITINNSKPAIWKYIDKSKGNSTNLIQGSTSIYRTDDNDFQYYTVKVRTPAVSSMSNVQTFKVTDNIGFTAIEPVITKVVKGTSSSASGTTLDSSAYTFTATSSDTTWRKNYNTELVFDTSKLDPDSYYYITYKTYLVTTIANSAKLVYSTRTDSATPTATITSNSVKYVRYDYKFTKTDQEGNPLQGAKFQVFASESDARQRRNPLKGILWDNTAGVYEWTSNSSGIVNILGAFDMGDTDNGSKTFWLVETKAPTKTVNGTVVKYNLLADPIQITVNTGTGNSTMTVVNSPVLDFPVTGGFGTMIAIMIGIILLGTAAVLVVRLKRKES